MGLWESVTTTAIQLPPEVAERMKAAGMNGMPSMAPTTMTNQSCITPDTWNQGLALTNARQGCTVTDKTVTPKGVTFTMTCAGRGGMTTTAHGDIVFESPEKVTSNIKMAMNMPQGPAGGTTTTEIKSVTHFVSADCGNVKPYTPKAAR
jgi:hypothetical protein